VLSLNTYSLSLLSIPTAKRTKQTGGKAPEEEEANSPDSNLAPEEHDGNARVMHWIRFCTAPRFEYGVAPSALRALDTVQLFHHYNVLIAVSLPTYYLTLNTASLILQVTHWNTFLDHLTPISIHFFWKPIETIFAFHHGSTSPRIHTAGIHRNAAMDTTVHC
jgi:hypothetical protein